MNFSNEDNTLQLFKYIPDATSQLLIQNSDTEELIQIPSICDDLLLSGLETASGWTLGGLPILLNTPLLTTDQPTTILSSTLTTPGDENNTILESDSILQLNDNVMDTSELSQTENLKDDVLVKAPTRIITEDGIFTSDSLDVSIENPVFVTSEIADQTVAIQSDDTTEEFVNINNVLVQKNVINNSDKLLLNVDKVPPTNLKVVNGKKKSVNRKIITKSPIANTQDFEVVSQIITDNALSLNINKHLSCTQPKELLQICNGDNITALVSIDSVLNNGLLLKTQPVVDDSESNDQVDDANIEPDSTVDSNDTEVINIVDLADVIMTYQCKKCDFSCSDQEEFLEHFNENHTQQINLDNDVQTLPVDKVTVENEQLDPDITNSAEIIDVAMSDGDASDDNDATIYTVYDPDESFTNISVTPDDIDQRKIMRVKRKPAKRKAKPYDPNKLRKQKPIILRTPENDKIYGEPQEENEMDMVSRTEDEESDEEEIKIYLCSECAEQFDSVEDCRNHMIQVHKLRSLDDKDPLENGLQDEDNLENVELTEEMKKRNRNVIEKILTTDIIKVRKNKCTVKGCQYRFAKPELLERHLKCHIENVKNQFKCPECEQIFPVWRTCSMHLWNCHHLDLDLYSCPLCDYRGQTRWNLTSHLKTHSEDREYVCPDCGKCFKQANQIINHRVIHLDKDLHDIPKWYSQKHCDKCDMNFADAKCLKKHIQAVHSNLKPFICNVCGHSCARKAMLQTHLRQHTGEKPYACKICYYKTGDHNSLRRHMMRHSGERPYKCPHCSYKAIQSISYKNHLASKHPGKGGAYSCTYCGFKSVNEESYVAHIKKHKKGLIDSNGKRKYEAEILNVGKTVLFKYVDSNSNNNVICDSQNTQAVTQGQNGESVETEDDETQHCFLNIGYLNDEQTVDTGGITIPADP